MMRVALVLVLAAAMPQLAPMAAAQTADCPAAPAIFPFAPPAGPMRFTIETDRPVTAGGLRRFGLEYRVQFHAVGRGHGLTVTLLTIDAPGAMRAGDAMAAIYKPMVGRPLELFYDADADKLHMSKAEADALWKHFADESAARAQTAKPGEARAVPALLLDLPVGQREQMLFTDLAQMLSFAGRSPGTDLTVPAGDPEVDCRLVRLTGTGRWAHGGPGFSAQTIWMIDRESGLVQEQREEVLLRPNADSAPQLAARTIRRLVPE